MYDILATLVVYTIVVSSVLCMMDWRHDLPFLWWASRLTLVAWAAVVILLLTAATLAYHWHS